jgi:murein DD-endopeptidase MepM/ murein hydrolase activator NlpD
MRPRHLITIKESGAKTKTSYYYPIDKDKVEKIYIRRSRTHRIYKNAIDYVVPIGTPIKAAADGLVIDVKADSNIGGSSRKYEKYENFIEIRHEGDEYSYYGHIKKNGAQVKIGDKIKVGQVIGFSGATGWLANIKEPHLHFMVGRYKYETLKIRFKL